MRTVYKYELSITDDIQTLNVPMAFQILKFGEQNERLVFWADVRPEKDSQLMKFQVVGTGHEIGDYPAGWLDTVQMSNGLVWHIYERL